MSTFVALPGAQAAPFADLTFTTLVTDPADFVGFHDILSVAVAEPGDETLVFKIAFASATAAPTGGYDVVIFVDPDGTQQAPGFTNTGVPTRFTNFGPAVPSSCQIDGTAGYCVLPYAKFAGGVGKTLTKVFATGYINTGTGGSGAGDSGPCPGPLASCLASQTAGNGGYGSDYTLTGCTKTDPAACSATTSGGGSTAPKTVYANLTGTLLSKTFAAATNGTYVYNVTSKAPNVDLTYSVKGNGSAQLTVKDPKGVVQLNKTLTGSMNGTVNLNPAGNGTWQYHLVLTSFKGSLSVDLAAHKATGSTGTSTGASGSAKGSSNGSSGSGASGSNGATGSDTGTDGASTSTKKGAPGLELAFLALALLGVVARRRR